MGGVTTGFSYGVYALLLFLGLNYALASLGALVLGILFGFKSQSTLVFASHDNRLIWRFTGCWLLVYLGNVTFIRALTSLHINAYVAGALAIPVNATLSYLLQRFVVFRRPGHSDRTRVIAASPGASRDSTR